MYLKIIVFLAGIFLFNSLYGQKKPPPNNVKKHTFGITPSNEHTIVEGLAIGLSTSPYPNDSLYVKINGLNLEIGPMGLVIGIYGTMFGLLGNDIGNGNRANFFTNYGYADSIKTTYTTYGTKVNGLSISLCGISDTFNKGLFINGLSGLCYNTDGVQISGLFNDTYEFNGLAIAGLANVTNKGNGVQIGLINKCNTGCLVQIGLINRIGKRVLPIINFRFRKN